MAKSTSPPEIDKRAAEVRTYRSPMKLAGYPTREAWEARCEVIRETILASAGLLPLPRRRPLRPKVLGRTEVPGVTIDRVYFESLPGFFVAGNLFRPTDLEGPLPAVLNAHGHWAYGRLESNEDSDIPRRCKDLARQGYVAFAYDMVGYNDTHQLPHGRVGGKREELWGISLLGLQLWNSMRVLDFISSLPDVDAERIACTGASGGGTQTFLLAAVDPRVKVSLPVCMVSASFHGGCVCENSPHLRLHVNNVEIAGSIAPRPQLLVSATGDWTKDTPRLEHPWLQGIYGLYDAAERVGNAHFDAGHNYNARSREAVYAWLAKWLGGPEQQRRFAEDYRVGYGGSQPSQLLVFYGTTPPKVKTEAATLAHESIRQSKAQLAAALPSTRAELARYRKAFGPVFRTAVAADQPAAAQVLAAEGKATTIGGLTVQDFVLGRKGAGDRVPAVMVSATETPGPAVLVVSGKGCAAAVKAGKVTSLTARLAKAGARVLAIDAFGVGAAAAEAIDSDRNPTLTAYNGSADLNRVQDVLTALGYLKSRRDVTTVSLIGLDTGGLWALLARARGEGVTACGADLAGFDLSDDAAFLDRLQIPLLRRAGDLRTALALAAPQRLALHNLGPTFPTAWAKRLYKALGAAKALHVQAERMGDVELAAFVRR